MIGNIIIAIIQNSNTKYRVGQLEKKVDKHNNLVERMYRCEGALDVHEEKFIEANHRLEELEGHR